MRCGEIWTVLDAGYASKLRLVVVVQDGAYAAFDSEIVCLMTSFDSSGIRYRVKIEPSETNGSVAGCSEAPCVTPAPLALG